MKDNPTRTRKEVQTPIQIEDSTVDVLSNPGGIDFGSGLTVTDDGDGSITVEASGSGSGDVTASANMTDNTIVRGDGGAKGVQGSSTLITDDGNVTTSTSLDGLLQNTVENTSANSANVVGATHRVVNDSGYWALDGLTNSGSTILGGSLINTFHHYSQGYADNLYTVDGNKDHVFFSDPTDSHNFSALSNEIMRLSAAGDLTATGAVTGSNLSGTNTGDETDVTIKTKLGAASTSHDGYLTQTNWDTFNDKADNPMTTQGDVVYGGASGTETRLGIGTAGQVLTTNAGATAPEWADAGGGGGDPKVSVEATGTDASATGTGAVVIGGNISSGSFDYAINIGLDAEAEGQDGIAIGQIARGGGARGIGIGHEADAEASEAVAIGFRAKGGGANSMVIGNSADGETNATTVYGTLTKGGGSYGCAYGYGADAESSGSVAIGYNADGGGVYSVGLGAFADPQAAGCMALGRNTEASQIKSIALGMYSETERYGELWRGADEVSPNNFGTGEMIFTGTTTDATPVEIFSFGVSNQRLVLQASSVIGFTADIVARDSTANHVAHYKIEGTIKRDAANNTSIVGTNIKTILAEEDTSWDVALTADDTNEALIVTVTGDATNSTIWNCTIKYTEARL